MAVSTIESHLTYFIETGELGLEKLVSPSKTAIITDWYLRNPTRGSGSTKDALGNEISYTELRFVWKYLIYTKQITV